MLGNYQVAAQLVASRVVLSSTELVSIRSNQSTWKYVNLNPEVPQIHGTVKLKKRKKKKKKNQLPNK
jgi:hypothetical protein